MPTFGIAIAVVAAAAAAVAIGVHHSHRPATDAADYLRDLELDMLEPGDYQAHLEQPFFARIVRPLGQRAFGAISRLTELFMSFPLLLLVIALGQTAAARFDDVTLHGLFPPGVLALSVAGREILSARRAAAHETAPAAAPAPSTRLVRAHA